MIPLHTHWEYSAARLTIIRMSNAYHLNTISENDKKEFQELVERVDAYENNPTPPNTIKAESGNVDNELKTQL